MPLVTDPTCMVTFGVAFGVGTHCTSDAMKPLHIWPAHRSGVAYETLRNTRGAAPLVSLMSLLSTGMEHLPRRQSAMCGIASPPHRTLRATPAATQAATPAAVSTHLLSSAPAKTLTPTMANTTNANTHSTSTSPSIGNDPSSAVTSSCIAT
jgi:hypothetical protein